jgi:hypothetical protein
MFAMALLLTSVPVGAQAPEATAKYTYFFTETNQAFEAAFDQGNIGLSPDGNKLVSVKLSKFSPAFRNWIKDNFPSGETADYAIDSYNVDCAAKTIGENQIVWYDASGTELTDYDFGGRMAAPIPYSMKENLMKKICGIP